VELNRQS